MTRLSRAQDRYVRRSGLDPDDVIIPGRLGASDGAVERIVAEGLWERTADVVVRGEPRARYRLTEAGRRYCDER